MAGCFSCLVLQASAFFFFLMLGLIFSLQLALFMLIEIHCGSLGTCLFRGLESFWTSTPILSFESFVWVSCPVLCIKDCASTLKNEL